ncbi:MAG: nitroreductase family deazaflavin-dependent oxidoreductase [Chloroflexota bacterium]
MSRNARRDAERELGDDLARDGKAVIVATTGRTSGRPARAAVGFVEHEDGSIVVAAGDPSADWALNLFADPRCTVTLRDRTWPATADVLEGSERNRAIADLILRFGTPAERLGSGPAFRLVPDERPA